MTADPFPLPDQSGGEDMFVRNVILEHKISDVTVD